MPSIAEAIRSQTDRADGLQFGADQIVDGVAIAIDVLIFASRLVDIRAAGTSRRGRPANERLSARSPATADALVVRSTGTNRQRDKS